MASPKTDTSGRIQKRETQAPQADQQRVQPTVLQIVQRPSFMAEIKNALPEQMKPERMVRMILTALRKTPALADCTQISLFSCIYELAQLGLEPNTPLGHAYLIPRKNECTKIIGYKGLVELARRAGVHLVAYDVREGDEFDYELGLNPGLHHKPAKDPERYLRKLTHAYAVARGEGMSPVFWPLSRGEIELRRARSSAPNSPAWTKDYDAMARKSACRALEPWIPKAVEMSLAVAAEERDERGEKLFDPDMFEAMKNMGVDTSAIDAAGESVDAEPEDNGVPEAKALSENNAGSAPVTDQLPLDAKQRDLAEVINGKK